MILTATRFLARFFSSSSTLLFQLPGRTSFSKWRISLASFQSPTSLRHLRYFRRYCNGTQHVRADRDHLVNARACICKAQCNAIQLSNY